MYENPEEVFGGTDRLLGLIELIYSAVDDVSLWPVVLDSVAETIAARESLLFTSFPDPTTPDVSCLARMDLAALVPYTEYYHAANVLAGRCDQMFPDGTPRFSDRAVPNAEFEKTEFCNDYFVPNGMYYSTGLKIPMEGLEPAYCAFMRPKHKVPFGEREGTVLSTLMPHLRRALMLHLKLSQFQLNTRGLERGLDAFGHAVFGLNCEGKVVLSNRRAERIATIGDGLRLIEGRLSATDPNEDHPFQVHLGAAVASGKSDGFSSGGSLLIRQRVDKSVLRVTITPMQAGLTDHYGQLAALVFVSDPSDAVPSRSTVLRSLYGLTPTEARVADLLADGNEVAEVAAKTSITLETARFHVKRVLNKTETPRQTELMRLMLSLPGQ